MTDSFFNKLVYSSPNEDGRIEARGLGLTANSQVLCISGCGARPLDLLTGDEVPADIVAIDFNPMQIHLLDLTMACFRELSHPELLDFLGVTPYQKRLKIYARLRPYLNADSRYVWDRRPAQLQAGVMTTGQWHGYLTLMAKLTVFRRGLIRQLFEVRDVETQARLWHNRWDNALWQNTLRALGNRWFWQKIVREPGAMLIPDTFDAGQYLIDCFRRFAETHFFQDSFFAHLLFFGKLDDVILPPYLQARNHDVIRDNLTCIRPVTASLTDFLATNPARFDAFSISDVASYAPPDDYAAIWRGLVRTANPNARLVERQFLVKRTVPDFVAGQFQHDETASAWALKTDNSLIYTFNLGTFHGNV